MTRQIYFIRHGIATEQHPQVPDETRPLTPAGIEKTQKVAQRLQALGIRFDLLLSSPLVRAQQTADLLQGEGLCSRVTLSDLLAPEGNFQAWLDWFHNWQLTGQEFLALVGHQPNLGEWAERFIWGEFGQALVLKKAGIIGVTLSEGGDPIGSSTLFWLTPPRYFI
ncbi:phosphohistidine phosphatase SixA [Synechococcales cyanobacterium C]|uniref:Phosphohistidine phosphatase SixA n=1 Tax=Petrachloros mirabilis ULC683 TaxID=2781853 RepID=A0A8K1ZY65_9CYAN|nr:phosphohistidine phosphatase SixA [Petrachloros mirabilis ULC683]